MLHSVITKINTTKPHINNYAQSLMYHQTPIGVKNWKVVVKDLVNTVNTLNLMEITDIVIEVMVHSLTLMMQ